MPTTAYVLIEAAPKKASSACAKIAKVPSVKSAHLVTGPFDISRGRGLVCPAWHSPPSGPG